MHYINMKVGMKVQVENIYSGFHGKEGVITEIHKFSPKCDVSVKLTGRIIPFNHTEIFPVKEEESLRK